MALVNLILDLSWSGNRYVVIHCLYHGVFIGLSVLRFVGFQRKISCLSVEEKGGEEEID